MTSFFHDDFEFVMPTVFKAVEYAWAIDLIENGIVRFSNLPDFRRDKDTKRGDPKEGHQELLRKGHRCTTDFIGPVYVWCCTLDANPGRILGIWQDRDCVIQILNTVEFTNRITTALKKQNKKFLPLQIGPVAYTKTEGGHEETGFADVHFQKSGGYEYQKEFRFVLTGITGDTQLDHIELNIGACPNIVRIALHRSS